MLTASKENIRLYWWTGASLLIICIMSFLRYNGILLLPVLFIFTIPFLQAPDKLAVVCLLLSSLSDYFSGAYLNLLSVYTFLLVICLLAYISRKRILLRLNVLPFFLITIVVWISYSKSAFNYTNGAVLLTFSIIMSAIIASTIKISSDTLVKYLPMCASILIVYYTIVELISTKTISSSMTIATEINHNSFGRSLAELTTVIATKVIVDKECSKLYKVLLFFGVLLTLLTGSRNAFLSLIVAIFFVFMFNLKSRGVVVNNALKFVSLTLILLIFADLVLPDYGFDISRFNYVDLISSGGTSRTKIWINAIPHVIRNYLWFGYGPGALCSANVIQALINRPYKHMHNTFVEAFGELGLCGLCLFLVIYIDAFRAIYRKTKQNYCFVFLLALFIDIFVNGLGESMFTSVNLWLLIGLCYSPLKRIDE